MILGQRSSKLEILDDPFSCREDIHASLRFMVLVNKWLGGARAVLDFFKEHAVPDTFTVLDLGTGSGDIPFAIAQWARQSGKKARITAIDLNDHCLQFAQMHFASPDIQFKKASAFDLEVLGSFDYVVSSMFFHHLSDEAIVRLLKIIDRHSRRGFVINDLYRCRSNFFGTLLMTLPTFKKILIHDAPLSVERAFRENDFLKYRAQSGIRFDIERKPVFRVVATRHVQNFNRGCGDRRAGAASGVCFKRDFVAARRQGLFLAR